jgi:hypothetical protein
MPNGSRHREEQSIGCDRHWLRCAGYNRPETTIIPGEEHHVETQTNRRTIRGHLREVFLSLVEAQDRRMTVLEAREKVSRRFHVSLRQVTKIEHEGLANEWPPLGEEVLLGRIC